MSDKAAKLSLAYSEFNMVEDLYVHYAFTIYTILVKYVILPFHRRGNRSLEKLLPWISPSGRQSWKIKSLMAFWAICSLGYLWTCPYFFNRKPLRSQDLLPVPVHTHLCACLARSSHRYTLPPFPDTSLPIWGSFKPEDLCEFFPAHAVLWVSWPVLHLVIF